MSQSRQTVPIKSAFIFGGRVGIWQTLQWMKALALRAARDPSFRQSAAKMVSNLPPDDYQNKVKTFFDFVHYYMEYTDDPTSPAELPAGYVATGTNPPAEYNDFLKDPLLVMEEIKREGFSRGDCDEYTMLFSALLATENIRHAMVALAIDQGDNPDIVSSDGLNHVVVGIPLPDGNYFLLDTVQGESQVDYQIKENLTLQVL